MSMGCLEAKEAGFYKTFRASPNFCCNLTFIASTVAEAGYCCSALCLPQRASVGRLFEVRQIVRKIGQVVIFQSEQRCRHDGVAAESGVIAKLLH